MVRMHINEPGCETCAHKPLKRDGEVIERRRVCARDICWNIESYRVYARVGSLIKRSLRRKKLG